MVSADFMLRPDYSRLGIKFGAAGASISTVFLFIRLWARKTQYRGLWWDDYILIGAWACQLIGNGLLAAAPPYGYSLMSRTGHGWAFAVAGTVVSYISVALGKTAFSATLMRLSTVQMRIVLWLIVVFTWGFTIAVVGAALINICDAESDNNGICTSVTVSMWVQVGNAVTTVIVDFVLAYLPWSIVSKIHLPSGEKWAVGVSMSLTGLAGLNCLARLVIGSHFQQFDEKGLDWSYGAIVLAGMVGLESVIYIVAQTVPLLRVLFISDRWSSKRVGSVVEIHHRGPAKNKGNATAADRPGIDALIGPHESIELVKLDGGKIVPANSEEGKAFLASKKDIGEPVTIPVAAEGEEQPATTTGEMENIATVISAVDDPVRKLWADMGLSYRARSLSPTSSPQQGAARHRREPSTMEAL